MKQNTVGRPSTYSHPIDGKKTCYVRQSGAVSQETWGVGPDLEGQSCTKTGLFQPPPIGFFCFPLCMPLTSAARPLNTTIPQHMTVFAPQLVGFDITGSGEGRRPAAKRHNPRDHQPLIRHHHEHLSNSSTCERVKLDMCLYKPFLCLVGQAWGWHGVFANV